MIDELATKCANGESLAELAKANSDCPSGAQGGDLGTFGRGQMVKAFEDAVYAVEVGQTTPVVETEFGYHIIQRTG